MEVQNNQLSNIDIDIGTAFSIRVTARSRMSGVLRVGSSETPNRYSVSIRCERMCRSPSAVGVLFEIRITLGQARLKARDVAWSNLHRLYSRLYVPTVRTTYTSMYVCGSPHTALLS